MHSSWFEKMGDAFKSVLIGVVMIWFSIPVLWVNERRSARQDSVISIGRQEITNVDASLERNEDNRGTLIRAYGGLARSMSPVADSRFGDVRMDMNCLRLKSTVEVFQWVEEKNVVERKDNVGGGTTQETKYSYRKGWCTTKMDSYTFKDQSHLNTVQICNLDFGVDFKTCDRVEYGEGFLIPTDLVETLSGFKESDGLFGQSLKLGTYTFELESSGEYYYYPSRPEAEVGDVRVKFEYVPDGKMTILGLQVASVSPDEIRDTFLPYRMVSRGCCGGISDEEKKDRLIKEGRKGTKDMYDEDACDLGPLNVICCCCTCACNTITRCCASLFTPQVYRIFSGDMAVDECWKQIEADAEVTKWILRFVGWVLMFTGSYLLFRPLIVAMEVIPFLGPYFSAFTGWALWVLCCFVTLAVSSLITSMSYMYYRPFVGILYMFLAGTLAAIPLACSSWSKSSGHH